MSFALPLSTVHVLGVTLHAITAAQLLSGIESTMVENRRAIVANVNVNAMNLAWEQPGFRAFLNRSDVVFCDGFGVKWGARLLGQRVPERITYADWMWQLAEFAEPRGFTFFFLGARPGVAASAAGRLRERFPARPPGVLKTNRSFGPSTPLDRTSLCLALACRVKNVG
jgi:N-acetylglucosaminyldiphosphoundecaprenol N-acetyl-beta-D-mannosaminyltransferase